MQRGVAWSDWPFHDVPQEWSRGERQNPGVEEGCNTRMRGQLPLNTPLHHLPVHRESAPRGGLSGHFRKPCILCVDDEIAGTTVRGEILKEHGYSVVIYHSPLDALYSDLTHFDIAILDFRMPGMNGRELFLRLRALGAKFPIVLYTGCADALSREDRLLFARCIDKGAPFASLLETIAEFLDTERFADYCG